jgi:hypothetical protein
VRGRGVKGKWAAGIAPRNFAWIVKDRLAISERPGGYARSHRPVRRQEEIIWIREQGFARVVSLLPSPHNLHAYEELGVASEHIPLSLHDDPRPVLSELYPKLAGWMGKGDKVLVHQEELGDRLQGVVAGFLVYAGMVPSPAHAIAIVEQINSRQMGPPGRELVAVAAELAPSA